MNTCEIRERQDIQPGTKGRRIIGDVLAFSSNAANVLHRGARDIIVANNQTFDAVIAQYEPEGGLVLVGDFKERQIEELTIKHGISHISRNNPSSAFFAPVEGQRVILKTNNGAEAVYQEKEKGADEIFLMSFMTAVAMAEWLKTHPISERTLFVPAGEKSLPLYVPDFRVREDEAIANVMHALVSGIHMIDDSYVKEEIEAARQFNLNTYPPEIWDLDTRKDDMNLVFDIDTQYTVVPQCVIGGDGFIHVLDASMTRT